jgi:hypothetical protein
LQGTTASQQELDAAEELAEEERLHLRNFFILKVVVGAAVQKGESVKGQ